MIHFAARKLFTNSTTIPETLSFPHYQLLKQIKPSAMITYLVQCYFPGPRSFFNQKEVKARDLLGSCASDIDLILDFWFYFDTYADEEIAEAIPSLVKTFHLFFTILGALCWFSLASDGRAVDWFIVRPLRFVECICSMCHRCCFGSKPLGSQRSSNRKVMPDVKGAWDEVQSEDRWKLSNVKVSTGFLLFCGIFLEDIPQIIISFLVQGYKQDGNGQESATSGLVVANMLTSVYNAVIKLADAWDKREDVVSVTEQR